MFWFLHKTYVYGIVNKLMDFKDLKPEIRDESFIPVIQEAYLLVHPLLGLEDTVLGLANHSLSDCRWSFIIEYIYATC